jgi:ABC-type branched-subunit amino acid transport system ATPase component
LTSLQVEGLIAGYGGMDIVTGVSLIARPSQVTLVIGPNGAGKSTLLKAIMGLIRPRRGRVLLGAHEITGLSPTRMVQQGLSYVPQTQSVFPDLTVQENLEMGAYSKSSEHARALARVYEYFPRLKESLKQVAGTMSGGQQRMLAIGRALMIEPQVLLLDEPSAGLSPLIVDMLFAKLREIADAGTVLLMVEQNVEKGLAIADYCYGLAGGKNHLEGDAPTFAQRESIRDLFLGTQRTDQ